MFLGLTALMHQCAPQVAPSTMRAIVRTESAGNPWRIGDNTTKKRFSPGSQLEAISLANNLISQGHSLDMGLGQINSLNLPKLGLSVQQVFDPCTNLKAASSVLLDGYVQAIAIYGQGQRALLSAISHYNTGSLTRGFSNGYVHQVVEHAHHATYASSLPFYKSITVLVVANGKTGTYTP